MVSISNQQPAPISREMDFAIQTNKYQDVKMFLSTGKMPRHFCFLQARKFQRLLKTHVLNEKGEVVFVGTDGTKQQKVVLDIDEARAIIAQYHSSSMGGHSGINSTLQKIAVHYTWHGIKSDITNYCKSCEVCLRNEKNKQSKGVKPVKDIHVSEPLKVVVMDVTGPFQTTFNDNKFLVTFIDCHTEFVELFAIQDKTAGSVVKTIKTFMCRWGAPSRLLFDQGRRFVAEVNEEAHRVLRMKRVLSSSSHPHIRQVNNTLRSKLTALVDGNSLRWDDTLEDALFSLRTQRYSESKLSPFLRMFGRHPRGAVGIGGVPAKSEKDQPSLNNSMEERKSVIKFTFQRDRSVITANTRNTANAG